MLGIDSYRDRVHNHCWTLGRIFHIYHYFALVVNLVVPQLSCPGVLHMTSILDLHRSLGADYIGLGVYYTPLFAKAIDPE